MTRVPAPNPAHAAQIPARTWFALRRWRGLARKLAAIVLAAACLLTGAAKCEGLGPSHRGLPIHSTGYWLANDPAEYIQIGGIEPLSWVQVGWTPGGKRVYMPRRYQ